MERPSPFIAALKIWVITLMAGPIFFLILYFKPALDNSADSGFGIVFNSIAVMLGMPFGFIFHSLPAAVLLWLALVVLYRFKPGNWGLLAAVAAITFALIVALFSFFHGFYETWDLAVYVLMIAYWIATLFGTSLAFRD